MKKVFTDSERINVLLQWMLF